MTQKQKTNSGSHKQTFTRQQTSMKLRQREIHKTTKLENLRTDRLTRFGFLYNFKTDFLDKYK